jgi:hypothetical protein
LVKRGNIWGLINSLLILYQVGSPAQKLVKRRNIWGLNNFSLIFHQVESPGESSPYVSKEGEHLGYHHLLTLHQVDSPTQRLVKRRNIWDSPNSSLILHQVDNPDQKLLKRRSNSSLILHQVVSTAQKLVKKGNIWGSPTPHSSSTR